MHKHKNITNVISTMLLVVFFLPITVLAFHSITNHKHEICSSKTEQHIHDKDLDCTLHLYKQSNSFLVSYEYQFFNKVDVLSAKTLKNNFLKNHQQLSFLLRGPPLHVQV